MPLALLDTSILNYNQAGPAVYTKNLYDQIIKLHHPIEVKDISFTPTRSHNKILNRFSNIITYDFIWPLNSLPSLINELKPDLIHFPVPISPVISNLPTIITIHDTRIITHPFQFPLWHRTKAKLLLKRSVENAHRIITISKNSKLDIIKKFNIPSEKISVIYNGVSDLFKPVDNAKDNIKQKYKLNDYILSVGTIEPRKNIVNIFKSVNNLKKKGFPTKLVHIGKKGWHYGKTIKFIRDNNLTEDIIVLENVSDQDLVKFYNSARLLVYPSLYEGFGLPILEAMACGCPVITSMTSSMPEVAGDAALLVDPYSIEDISASIQKILEDDELAYSLRQKSLKRVRMFSWETCAKETLRIYQEVLH